MKFRLTKQNQKPNNSPCFRVKITAMGTKSIMLMFVAIIFLPIFFVHGQTTNDVASRRTQLESDLKTLEAEIDAQRKILEEKQKQSVSLERDIAIYDARIKESNLSIKARNITINNLIREISEKEKTIGILSNKIDREKQSLAQLIRKTRELEDSSIIELMASDKSVSEFFSDADTFISVNKALQNSVQVVSEVKDDTTVAKKSLESKKEDEVSLRTVQELQRKRLAQDKSDRNILLKVTRGKEEEYKKVLKEREKSAASIRSELFILQGSKAISFEKALEYADVAYQKMGIRQAFLLGIITEETNLGENLGSGNWRVDMKNPRDTEPFLDITSRLGLDPDKMPVSKKPGYGYGGAMGPAQFIPSTWKLYEERIAQMTGHNPPNPWEPYDAFMASALLLKDNGGAGGDYNKERRAALKYLAGANWNKRAYAFYGDDVMALAAKYQAQINVLRGN